MNPDLVIHDREGKPYTVRYDQVNAMSLNEFLKEHLIVEEQQRTFAELISTVVQERKDFEAFAIKQQKQIQAITANLQKVGAQFAAARPACRTAGRPEVSKPLKGRIRYGSRATRVALNP